MDIHLPSLLAALAVALNPQPAVAGTVTYQFSGGSMAPAVSGMPSGVTASSFSLGTFTPASLSDNGGSGNSLRISRGDIGTSSATALAGGCLSFSLTVPAGITLNLTSLALDFTSGGVTTTEYINARIFSSIDGFDDVTADTIGTLGRVANGADSGTMSISLTSPDSNPVNGANSNNGDFDNLSNRTVTFYLPFIRDSQTTAADYLDIDNITLAFQQVLPPTEISSFTATAITSFEVALAWNESLNNETGFVIERAMTGSSAWETIITTAANATSIRDFGVTHGTSYTYRISATLDGGGTPPSAVSGAVAVPAVAGHSPLIIMPLGDSITEGAGAGGGYRDPLFTALTHAGFEMQYVGTRTNGTTTALIDAGQVNHEGHGSYATTLISGNLDGLLNPVALPYGTPPNTNNGGYWLTGIAATRGPVYPDLVLLMIGTNDLGMFQRTPAQVYAYYDLLLAKLVTLRPSAMILCSTVPPYNGDAYVGTNPVKDYSQREANNLAFSQMLPNLVAAYQTSGRRVRICDIRQKINPSNAATLIGGDGVHPNQAGYNAIAAGWFEAIQQLPLMASWRILHFGSATATGRAADAADPDGDGATNLTEYAFGTDPLAAEPSRVLTGLVVANGTRHVTLTFPRRKHADVRYIVESSPDLTSDSWSADTLQTGAPTDLGQDFEQVTFRDRHSSPPDARRFMRVRVEAP